MSGKRKLIIVVAVIAWLVVFAGIGMQVYSGHVLHWSVVSGGGQEMGSGSHSLDGTTGQVAVGMAQAGSHGLSSGFWYVQHGRVPVSQFFVPLILK